MNALLASLHSSIGSLRTWVIAGVLALGSLDAAAQAVAPLFTPPPAVDTVGVRATVKRAADRPYIARQRAVGIDFQQLQPQAGRSQLALSVDLFDGVALLADLDRVDVRSAKSYSWFGRVRGLPNSRATLTVVDGVLAGNLIVLDDWNRVKGSYQIQSAGDGLYLLEEINPHAFPADHPPGIDPHPPIPRVSADAPSLRDAANADTLVTIDVLVVYSNEVASAAGSAIGAQIQAAVDAANTAYANSGINARLRLVHYAAANYAQHSDFSTNLNRLTGSGDGYMDDVHALRDAYGADMVSLWVEGGSYCGIGWVGPYASYAFTVVARGCATGNLTFAHELGHNMGALHDPYVDLGTNPFAYGHGHINLVARWRTVMSYNDQCAATAPGTSCTRIPYFSNPNLTYGGAALGTAEAGTTPTSNNARVHNNVAANVAAFRPTVVGTPCTYTVSPTTASPTAAGGTATATVTTQAGCTWTASSSAVVADDLQRRQRHGKRNGHLCDRRQHRRRALGHAHRRRQDRHRQSGRGMQLCAVPDQRFAHRSRRQRQRRHHRGDRLHLDRDQQRVVALPSPPALPAMATARSATLPPPTPAPTRSANLTIGGQTFMVTQANGCTYVASPTSVSAVTGASSGSVAVTAGTGCTWTASSSASWLTVTSGASGSGNGSVGYAVAANTGAARSATLTVGGKTVTVTQAALSCNYTFAPTSASLAAAAGSSSVAVTVPTGCTWTASQQRVVAHRHLRRLRQRQRHRRLRGHRQHRPRPQRDPHHRRADLHGHAGERLHVRRLADQRLRRVAGEQRQRRRHRRHRLHLDREQQRVVADRHLRRLRLRQRQRRLRGRGQHRCRALGDADGRRQDGARSPGSGHPPRRPCLPLSRARHLGLERRHAGFRRHVDDHHSPAQSVTFTNTGASAVTVSALTASTHFDRRHTTARLSHGRGKLHGHRDLHSWRRRRHRGNTRDCRPRRHADRCRYRSNGERSLVTHYYRSILRRAPDPQGKAGLGGGAGDDAVVGRQRERVLVRDRHVVPVQRRVPELQPRRHRIRDRSLPGLPQPRAGPARAGRLDGAARPGRAAGGRGHVVHVLGGVRYVHPEPVRQYDSAQGDRHGDGLLPRAAVAAARSGRFQCLAAEVPHGAVRRRPRRCMRRRRPISSRFTKSPEYLGRGHGRTRSTWAISTTPSCAAAAIWAACSTGSTSSHSGAQSRDSVRRQFLASPEFKAAGQRHHRAGVPAIAKASRDNVHRCGSAIYLGGTDTLAKWRALRRNEPPHRNASRRTLPTTNTNGWRHVGALLSGGDPHY